MSANAWPVVALSDVMEVKHGFAFPGEGIRDHGPGDILLTPGNFAVGGGFKAEKFKYFDGVVPDDYVLQEGDLIVTMTDLSKEGDTLGYPALVPKSVFGRFLHNQRLGKISIRNDALVEKSFLSYALRTPQYRHEILASATGSTVKHTSPSRILAYKMRLPPPEEQHAIAHILGTLDDKIELNRRSNATLEAMARALFKDWFVDFGPVRAKREGREPYLAHELWSLFPNNLDDEGAPANWPTVPLADLIELNPYEPLRKGTPAPYLDMASLRTSGSWTDQPIERAYGSGMRFRNGDALLARITPCLENGKTAFVQCLADDQIAWGSTEYIVMRSRGAVPSEYGYLLARDAAFRAHAIRSMTGTSGRQRVQAEALYSYPVCKAPDEVFVAFGALVKPWFDSIKAKSVQSETLATLRDTLLPKLLSGELRVRDAEEMTDCVA